MTSEELSKEELLFPSFEYHLDDSDPDIVVLGRQDDAFVAALSARGRLGRIYFYRPDETLEGDFVDRGSNPVLHLHTDMLSSVLALLNSEKPLFVEFTEQRGGLTTTEDSVL